MSDFIVHPKYRQTIGTRFDAGETAMIARSLDYVEQQITEVMYAQMRALQFVPTIPGIPPGASTYTFVVVDKVGVAAAASEVGKDLPRADLNLTENTSSIRPYGATYGYTTQELRAIAMAATKGVNLQLDVARAKIAAEMIARKIDSLVAFGDPNNPNIGGFLTNSNVHVASASENWSLMTADALLAELYLLANYQREQSKEIFEPNAILLPTAQMDLVATLPYGTAGLKTVLGFFNDAMRAAGRNVEVASWPLLSTAGAAGVARAVAYKRDVDVVGAIVPLAFVAQPPVLDGLRWDITCECECGGAAVKQPLGMLYRDGI